VAVLIGDYWLVKALDIILKDAPSDNRVIKIFSNTLSALAEGELLQLQKAQSGDTQEEDYLRIIYNKTASLFEAACLSAVLSVSGSEQMEKAAIDYSYALGIAFQIQDDILDYAGTDSVGKPLGVDVLEQKITIPLLGALSNVSEDEQKRVRGLVNDIVGHPEHRDEIVAFVKENGGLEYARRRLDEYVEKAVHALDVLPDSQEKEYLVALAHFTAKRDK
jgi:octaprenyl-diphosphate synthase